MYRKDICKRVIAMVLAIKICFGQNTFVWATELHSIEIATNIQEASASNLEKLPDFYTISQEINLNTGTLSLVYLDSSTLSVSSLIGTPIPQQDVSWKSDNNDVAVIEPNGRVTAKGVGSTNISATVGDASAVCVVSVSPKTVSLDATDIKVENKLYDGTAKASVTGQLKIDNSVNPELVGFSKYGTIDAVFDSKDASYNPKNVAISINGFVLDNINYAMPEKFCITGKGYINPALASIKIDDQVSEYSGQEITMNNVSAVGVNGERPEGILSIEYKKNGFHVSTVNIGVYDVTAYFECTDKNYIWDTAKKETATLTIVKKLIRIIGINGGIKTYDGTNLAGIEGEPLLDDISPDEGLYIKGNPVAIFDDANAGNDKNINISGYELLGTKSNNYSLEMPKLKGNILPKQVTITGLTVDDKVYDGGTDAVINVDNASINGVLALDDGKVTINTDSGASFADKNVGIKVKVALTEPSLSGEGSANYKIISYNSIEGNIMPAPLSVVGCIPPDKTYDGTNQVTATGGTLEGIVKGDDVRLFGTPVGSLTDKNCGIKQAIITGIGITGADSSNYFLPEEITAELIVLPKELSLSGVSVVPKVYDSTIKASIKGGAISGVIFGDDVNLDTSAIVASFLNPNVGSDKPVTLYGKNSLYGADAPNYILASPQGLCGEISKADSQVILTPFTYTYDGTGKRLNANVSGVADEVKLAGELVLTYYKNGIALPQSQAPINAGEYQVIASFGGNNNYNPSSSPPATLLINKADIQGLKFVGTSFIYDGEEKQILLSENVPLGVTFLYANNKATDPGSYTTTVRVWGDNYIEQILSTDFEILKDNPILSLALSSNSVEADEEIEITATINNSQTNGYEKNLPSNIIVSTDKGDSIPLTGSQGVYKGKFAAPNILGEVTLTANALTTFAQSKYYNQAVSNSCVLSVSNKQITKTTIISDKYTITYGESIVVMVNVSTISEKGDFSGDIILKMDSELLGKSPVNSKGQATFTLARDKLKASNNPQTVSAYYAGNQSYGGSTAETTVLVLPKEINHNLSAEDKEYDGKLSAKTNIELIGVLLGDELSAEADAVFDSADIGTGKTVTVNKISLKGADKSNYILSNYKSITASISPRQLIASFTVRDKEFDNTNKAELDASLDGVINGEKITATAVGEFLDANVGANKRVKVNFVELAGATAKNYIVTSTGELTANIIPKYVVFSLADKTVAYNGFGQDIVAYSDPQGIELVYSFTKNGSAVTAPFISSGEYIVSVSPKSPNYTGQAGAKLTILPKLSILPQIDPPAMGTNLTTPAAIISQGISYINPDNGKPILPPADGNITASLVLAEPNSYESTIIQDSVSQLGKNDGFSNLCISLQVTVSDGEGNSYTQYANTSGDITICLPYPLGFSGKSHNFSVFHLDSSKLEEIKPIAKEGWLEFNVATFSPFIIAYTKKNSILPNERSTTDYDLGYGMWSKIALQISEAKDGDIISVFLGVDDKIPAYIIDMIVGRNVNLEFNYGDQKLIINGANLPPIDFGRVYYSLSMLENLCKNSTENLASTQTVISEKPKAAKKEQAYSVQTIYQPEAVLDPAEKLIVDNAVVSARTAGSPYSFLNGILIGSLLNLFAMAIFMVIKKKITKKA